ncbi:unnamed protein product [Cunninghamella blakesleeana]
MYSNFEEWIKMATDNKINAANTWNFALIDYFHEMTFIRDGDSINFQRASCTLDGCVKIYTSRVDSVASETGKLLTGLADSSKDGGDDIDMDGEEGTERRIRRRANRSETILLKDFSSIALKKLDVDFSVDPLFKKTSADFDEGGARGLLLNHLNLDQDCKIIFDSSDAKPEDDNDNGNDNNIVSDQQNQTTTTSHLNSEYNDNNNNDDDDEKKEDNEEEESGDIEKEDDSSKEDEEMEDGEGQDKNKELYHQLQMGSQLITYDEPTEQPFVTQESVDITNLKAKLPSDDLLGDLQICPALLDIDFFSENANIPNLDDPEDITKDKDETMADMNDQDHSGNNDDHYDYGFDAFDFNDTAAEDINNDTGEYVDPFDNDIDNEDGDNQRGIDGNDQHDDGDDEAEEDKDNISGSIFRNLTSNQENELFSYFDTTLSKNWAGPEHWKLRKIKKTTVNDPNKQQESPTDETDKNDEANNTTQPQKKKNTEFSINFLEGDDVKESQIFATSKLKSGISLTQLKDSSVTTLPDDQHFSSKQLLCFYLKPAVLMNRRKFKKNKIISEVAPEIFNDTQRQDDGIDFEQDPDVQFWADQQPDDILQDHLDFNMETDSNTMAPFDDVSSFQDTFYDDYTNDASTIYDEQLITNHQVKKTKPPYVDYARTAKRVDVKKLKDNLWKALTLNPNDKNNRGPTEQVHGEKKFTEVIHDLKKMYSAKLMKDISVPFCFICLLHLANEKNLSITGLDQDTEDNDDHVIGDEDDWLLNEDRLNEIKILQNV